MAIAEPPLLLPSTPDLLGMPNEIQDNIMGCGILTQHDLRVLSLICQKLYLNTRRHLSVAYNRGIKDEVDLLSLVKSLAPFIDLPGFAPPIKAVAIQTSAPASLLNLSKQFEEAIAIFEALSTQGRLKRYPQLPALVSGIKRGGFDAAAAMLLMLLSGVSELAITYNGSAVYALSHHVIRLLGCTTTEPPCVLPSLTKVTLIGGLSLCIKAATLFACPSLREVTIQNIFFEDQLIPNTSEVTKFAVLPYFRAVVNTKRGSWHWNSLLDVFKGLKHLSIVWPSLNRVYRLYYSEVHDERSTDSRPYLHFDPIILTKHAATLEELTLETPYHHRLITPTTLGPAIRDLPKLKMLYAHKITMFGSCNLSCEKLVTALHELLPTTLEKIVIYIRDTETRKANWQAQLHGLKMAQEQGRLDSRLDILVDFKHAM